MAHAASVFFTRSQHIPPQAFLLALLLHALTVLALWWLPTLSTFELPTEDPIDVTVEPPPPPPPPSVETPPPAQAVVPPQASPSRPQTPAGPPAQLGILPPIQANPTSDEPKAMSDEEAQQPPPAPEQPPKPENPFQPPAPPTPEQPPQQAAVAPPPAPPSPAPVPAPPPSPQPRLEQALPPLEAPPPPITASDFPKPVPPPPPPPQPPKPQPAPVPQHATAPPQQKLLPSPLSSAPQQRPPTDSQASAPAARFVNPADAATRGKAIDAYLWQVARQASQYRYYSSERREEGTVVARLTIARDGRLLGISIAQSSGFPVLDKGVLETFRAGAPYPRIPNDIPGDPVTFTLPVTSRYHQ